MDSRRAAVPSLVVLLGALAVLVGVAALPGGLFADYHAQPPPDGVVTGNASTQSDDAVVSFWGENGTALGSVTVTLADTPSERATGLSDTESLATDEGMLFVYDREERRAFVMREMDFPLDMVFVGTDGRVNAIHHAPVPPPGTDGGDLTRYTGEARWVLEVNEGWTDRHDVTVGTRVHVDYTGPHNSSAGLNGQATHCR